MQEGDALTQALLALDGIKDAPPHLLLSASLGGLDPAKLAPDMAGHDEILRRLARHAAWAGKSSEAGGLAARAADPASILLDVAAIGGVVGDFEQSVDAIRLAPDANDRVGQFRFVARERAEQLDTENWMGAASSVASAAPVRVIRAATQSGQAADVITTSALTVSVSGGSGSAMAAPPMPDLDVEKPRREIHLALSGRRRRRHRGRWRGPLCPPCALRVPDL